MVYTTSNVLAIISSMSMTSHWAWLTTKCAQWVAIHPPQCEVTDPHVINDIVNIPELCQDQKQCEIHFQMGLSVTINITDFNHKEMKCEFLVLSLTYRCISKYCIEINKSLQLLAVLTVSANTKKAVYWTIPNALFQHYIIDLCSQYIRARMTNWCVNIVSAFTRVACI